MPTKEEMEMAALDYGVLANATREKRIEKEKFEEEIATLTEEKARITGEIDQNREANDRIRAELISEEKRLEDLRKQNGDELLADRQIVEAQRRDNDQKIRELNALSQEMEKRDSDLTARERAIGLAQNAMDARAKKLTNDWITLEDEKKSLGDRESKLATDKRDLDRLRVETDELLRKANATMSNASAAMETAKNESRKASDDRLKEQANMIEAQNWGLHRQAAEKQIRQLLPLLYETKDYIRANIKSPEVVDLFIRSRFMAEAQLPDSITNP